MKLIPRAMRVRHYIKNLLILAPLICSGRLFGAEPLAAGLWGFAAFCLLSSAVYILNDLRDVEKDRRHPVKRGRPIASGELSVRRARVLLGGLLAAAVLLAGLAGGGWRAYLFFAGYFTVNIGYSLGLKNLPLLDVALLVSGFLLRVLYGAAVTDTRVSSWLYLTVLSAAFCFALGKRRGELAFTAGKGETRAVLRFYTREFLDKNMYMCLSLTNVFYALWSMDAATAFAYGGHSPVWSVPIVLLICMRYSMDVERETDGDPVEVLFHDKWLFLLCLLYAAAMLYALYVL